MLEGKIRELITHIKNRIQVFGENGFYVDFFKENKDGIDGVTDTLDAYFFIQQKHRSTADEYKFTGTTRDDSGYQVSNVYQFIAGLGCVNKANAAQALINAITSYGGLNISIISASFNSELIYQALYQKHYTAKGQNLIMIEFIVTDLFLTSNICEIAFCEDCCARTTESCWCGCYPK